MQKKHGTPPLLSAFCFITVFGGAPGRTRTVRPEKTSVLGLNNVDFGDTINIGYNVTLQSSPFNFLDAQCFHAENIQPRKEPP